MLEVVVADARNIVLKLYIDREKNTECLTRGGHWSRTRGTYFMIAKWQKTTHIEIRTCGDCCDGSC